MRFPTTQEQRQHHSSQVDLNFTLDLGQRFRSVGGHLVSTGRLTADDLIGRTVAAAFGTEVPAPVLQAALEGEAATFQQSIPGGELNPYQICLFPLRDPTGSLFGLAGCAIRQTVEAIPDAALRLTALSATVDAVLITDAAGRMLWANPAFSCLTGFALEDLMGKPSELLLTGAESPRFDRRLVATLRRGRAFVGRISTRQRNGTPLVGAISITPIRQGAGEVTHYVALIRDVTQHRKREEKIAFLASHDSLTGLINRATFHARLERAVMRGRQGQQSALVILDLDHFKLVNDTVGHLAGDHLLINIARLMSETIGPGWEVARLGGDEFGLLLEGLSVAQARELGERIRSAIDGYRYHWGTHVFAPTASIGVARIDGSLAPDTVFALADSALYTAKRTGKNRVAVRTSINGKDANLATANVLAQVKDAIAAGRFEIHYQPVTRLVTGQTKYVEALVRMRGEAGEVIPPGYFIPIAEQFGLMPEIDRYVIRHAIERLGQTPGLRVFINLSGLTLADPSLGDYIRQVITENGASPEKLCFEVTESAALHDMGQVRDLICELKQLGCRFAIDDFGAGFASFTYLRALPVDYIKLDGSFTQDLDSNTTNRSLAKAVIDVAHALGKQVIAEQIERRSDADVLHELGVEYGQGYLWGRPTPLPQSNR